VVCLAFDLGKGNLTNSDNMTLLLLFLNSLRWLFPPDSATPTLVPAGEAFFLPVGTQRDSLQLLPPGGEAQKVETDVIEVDRVGEYRLTGSQYHATLLANLFDENESDIGRSDGDNKPVVAANTAVAAPQELTQSVPVEFGRLLYYVAAGLLLFEWLYALWRYSRTSSV
jgi:hypothetical protein